MRYAAALKKENRLLGDALAAFTRATGLKATALARETKAAKLREPDAEILIDYAGKQYRYLVEMKTVDRAVTLAHAKQQLDVYGKHGILVAPYLTAELANYCREKLDLQFIDTAGNAYLRRPGLYVYIQGERAVPNVAGTTTRGAGTAGALRVVFALLCRPELLNAPYRNIAAAARVALGTVGWVFNDLEARGLVIAGKKKRNRRLLNEARLVDEWITNYPIKLRPKLVRRFRAPDPNWWQNAQPRTYRGVWGGEVAADRLTGNREPTRFTIYLRGDPLRFILANKLRADPEGDVEILEKFWNFETPEIEVGDVAPPLLVYADLMATLDPRNHATAKIIYDKYIADGFNKA